VSLAAAAQENSQLNALRTPDSFPPMQRITIKRGRTWHYRKMRRYVEPSNGLAPSGYDFRKGQLGAASEHEPCEAHLGWPFLWFVTGRIAAIFQGKASNLPVKKLCPAKQTSVFNLLQDG
jgi:hypothetical protein